MSSLALDMGPNFVCRPVVGTFLTIEVGEVSWYVCPIEIEEGPSTKVTILVTEVTDAKNICLPIPSYVGSGVKYQIVGELVRGESGEKRTTVKFWM